MYFSVGQIVKIVTNKDEIFEGRIFGINVEKNEGCNMRAYINIYNFADNSQYTFWADAIKSIDMIDARMNILQHYVEELNSKDEYKSSNIRINKIKFIRNKFCNRWQLLFMYNSELCGSVDMEDFTSWELMNGFDYCTQNHIRIIVSKNEEDAIFAATA